MTAVGVMVLLFGEYGNRQLHNLNEKQKNKSECYNERRLKQSNKGKLGLKFNEIYSINHISPHWLRRENGSTG